MPVDKDRLADMFGDVMEEAIRLREAAQTATDALKRGVEEFEIASRHATRKVEATAVSLPNAVEKAVKEQLAAPAATATESMVQRLDAALSAAERAASAYSSGVGVLVAAVGIGFLLGLCSGAVLFLKLFP